MSESLVKIWRVEIESHGSLADGIRAMNETLGAKYTNSRVNEWQDGRQKLPKKAARYMLQFVLPQIMKQHNVSNKALREITDEIMGLLPE
ncbi:hypothetical protein ABT56_15530 [Photobacterium aquae]|uniref:Uncharacterized protein n=1 Tax=Photobacterium aquae TaxID=1195763 RepID=A0A0J1JP91_9GAMM|nr:hypothetical protein [Photobacterium aquae]KLV04037.1 hypothetical protein ABT56_15530 [Photobacterium aquae]